MKKALHIIGCLCQHALEFIFKLLVTIIAFLPAAMSIYYLLT